MDDPLLTDAKGRPLPKPLRHPDESTTDYLRRYWAWKDSISDIACRAFDKAFKKALRE